MATFPLFSSDPSAANAASSVAEGEISGTCDAFDPKETLDRMWVSQN